MATAVVANDIVNVIASEMASGIERAVGWWMSQIEAAMSDPKRTTLGRLAAVREILQDYKQLHGGAEMKAAEF